MTPPRLVIGIAAAASHGFRPGRTLRPLLAALTIILLAGCSKIHNYEVRPLTACPDEPVRIVWDVSGRARLSASPPVDGLGEVADSGATTVRVAEDTRFTLAVSAWFGDDSINQQDVTVVTYQGRQTIGETTRCGRDEVFAELTRPASELDQRLRVAEIALGPGLDRELVVEHQGATAVLRPDAPTSRALRGTSPGGAWILRSRLDPGEVCGQPSDTPPPEALWIDIQLQCLPAGRP